MNSKYTIITHFLTFLRAGKCISDPLHTLCTVYQLLFVIIWSKTEKRTQKMLKNFIETIKLFSRNIYFRLNQKQNIIISGKSVLFFQILGKKSLNFTIHGDVTQFIFYHLIVTSTSECIFIVLSNKSLNCIKNNNNMVLNHKCITHTLPLWSLWYKCVFPLFSLQHVWFLSTCDYINSNNLLETMWIF